MEMSIEQDLLNLKTKSEKLNTLKIETSTRLSSLEAEKLKLLDECNQLGIDPASIEQTLIQEEAQLQKEVSEIEIKINGVLDALKNT